MNKISWLRGIDSKLFLKKIFALKEFATKKRRERKDANMM